MIKNAFLKNQGKVLADASPSNIEKILVGTMKDAIGNFDENVKITPLLKIEKEADDLSGDVEKGYGAISLTHKTGTLIHVPFMIYDGKLLPFDSIRLGEEQTPYEKTKLRKIFASLDKRMRDGGGTTPEDQQFEVMSLAEIEDVPNDNGFLGTILDIRNDAQSRNNRGRNMMTGDNGTLSMFEQTINKQASAHNKDALFEHFDSLMTKIAATNVYSEDDVKTVANKVQKKAADEYEAMLNSEYKPPASIKSKNILRRETEGQKTLPMRSAENGQQIEFPVGTVNNKERRVGKIFKNLRRIGIPNESAKRGYDALVVDNRGNYSLLQATTRPLAYQNGTYVDVKIPTASANTLRQSAEEIFSILLNAKDLTISVPFRIVTDFTSSEDKNGVIKTYQDSFRDGGRFHTADDSSLFSNVLEAEEVIDSFADFSNLFTIVVTREGANIPLGEITREELMRCVSEQAVDMTDRRVAEKMLTSFAYNKRIFVIPGKEKILALKGSKLALFTSTKQLTGHSKEASFEDLNRVTIRVNEMPKPATYDVHIDTTRASAVEGTVTKRLDEKVMKGISQDRMSNVLRELGFSYQDIEKASESLRRTGREITLKLPNKALAKNVSVENKGENEVKKAVKNILENTFNVKNYTPVMRDVISDGLAGVANTILKSANESLVVAQEFEKLANTTRDENITNTAFLMNAKYHMDKLAADMHNSYVTNGMPVFEELRKMEGIIKEAAECNFNSTHPELPYELQKQAAAQYDGLMHHVSVAKRIVKHDVMKRLGGK